MGKKTIIFSLLVFSLLFLSLVSATTYQQNEIFNYNHFCNVNGTVCDNTFLCNLTISSPEGNILVNNQPMTYNTTFFNYTVSGLEQMNVYPPLSVSCTDGNVSVSNQETIEVTANGEPYRSVPTPYILTFLAIIFFVGNKYLSRLFKSNILTIFGGMLFLIAGILTLYPGFNYTNWTTLEGLALGIILIGIGGTVMVESGEEYLE